MFNPFVISSTVPIVLMAAETAIPSLNSYEWVFSKIIAGCLVYIAWTLKRYVKRIDDMHNSIGALNSMLTVIATEHRKNHSGSALESMDLIQDLNKKG